MVPLDEARPRLAQLLKKLRDAKGWSQLQLSALAHISARTISHIEAQTLDHHPRPKVLIKLALALGHDAKEFLEIMGHSVSEEKVIRTGKSVGLKLPGLDSLDKYFESLSAKIQNREAVMCITFMSEVGYRYDSNAIKSLINLLDKQNLWLGLLIPFPQPATFPISQGSHLISYYQKIYSSVNELAIELRRNISTEKRERVSIFYPSHSDHDFLSPPHLTINLSHSTFLTILPLKNLSEKEEDSRELGVWGTTRHDMESHWIPVFPAPIGANAAFALELMKTWEAYVEPIVSTRNTSDHFWVPEKAGYWESPNSSKLKNLESDLPGGRWLSDN